MSSRGTKRVFSLLLSVLFVLSLLPASALAEGTPGTGPIVIYHVYGGGGNSGATYKNDFVVLKNIGSTEVDIKGYTLWYTSAGNNAFTSSASNVFTIPNTDTVLLAPGGYCFIQLAAGTGGIAYPTINPAILSFTGAIAVGGTAGKIALTSDSTAPTLGVTATEITSSTDCLKDFVGFGTTATHYLGTGYAPAPSNTTAILRQAYTGSNAADYIAQPVTAANLDYLFVPETKCPTPTAAPAAGAVLTGTTVALSSVLRNGTNLPVYYTLDGTDPTAASTLYTAPISLGSTPGTVTIKAIAIDGVLENSDIATFAYTLDDIKTIAGARGTAAGIVKTKGVITFVEYSGSPTTSANVTIQDGTGGIVARFTDLGGATPFEIGKELTVAGTRGTYNGLEQITLSYTDTANFTIGSTATLPAPQTVTLAQLAGSNGEAYESERVKIVGATLGTINTSGDTLITQDSNTLNINKIPVLTGIVEGNSVTVVGVLTQTAAAPTYKLRVASASDVTLYTAIPDPITTLPVTPADCKYISEVPAVADATTGVTVVGQLVYRFGNYDNTNTAILQDVINGEIVAIQIYNALSSFQLGDVVTVTGKKTTYGGVTQIESVTASALVEHPSVMIPAQEFETIAEVLANKADLVSEWVLIKNVKLGAYNSNGSTTVSDVNSSTIPIYRAATYPYGVAADEVVNLYACVSKYNTTDQLRVGNSTDYVVANDTKAPLITLKTAYLDAKVNEDYVFGATIQDNVGIASATLTYSINGAPGVELNMTKNATTGDYEATIPASAITASASQIVVTINAKDAKNNAAIEKTWTLLVKNEPQVMGVTPLANTATGDVKKPLISVAFKNGGSDTAAVLKLNGGAGITMAVADNHDGTYTASYTPSDDLADGKYTAEVTLTPATSGATAATYTWVFTVGEALYTAYFGQLHSHTAQYSDGSGTLAEGLNYIKNISDAENVQFVAFTDHSNYFDAIGAGNFNPAEALNDKNLMTSASRATWEGYTGAMRSFNAEAENVNNIVAIPGFEMTWSGGPGHINTFNSVGLVSRNNTALNNKTADAGMKLYYDTLIQNTDPLANLSQFNHPGTTFGTFSDFAYYTPAYDAKMVAVEVGNGEGAIGSGGYFPSYAEYTKALDKGWHVAPTNNQDNHKGQWGNANTARTVILTDDLSENGLLIGLKNMTVYTTEDKNLNISYTVNEQIMGSIISEVPTENLRFAVNVNDPNGSDVISKIEVITNSGRIAESKTFTSNSAVWNFELPAAEGYYYLRVTQADMNIAVTAPVWIGQAALTGINSLECSTKLPVTGEELTLTTKLFNGESTEATLKSITYQQGETVLKSETPNTQISAFGTLTHTLSFTPTVAGSATVMVTAIISSGGVEREYSQSINLKVYDSSKMVYIGIDASHYNEYVSGNYKDSMGNFTNMAVEYGVRVVELKTSEALIAATTDPHYKILVLTPPTRRNGNNFLIGYKNYTDDEIAAVAAFAQAGNTVIVTCWGDFYEGYTKYSDGTEYTLPATDHMAAQQNKLLEALGASLRVSDDEIKNDNQNGGQPQRLYLKDYNLANPFLARVDADVQVYSNYAGSTIYAVDGTGAATATLPSSVSPMVYAFSDSYSADDDKDTYAGITIPKYGGKYMVLASETVSHANGNSSTVIVAGSCFMSNFEIQVDLDSYATPAYSNYTILENVVQSANPAVITPIADVQAEPKEGESFVIRGVVTSNASGYDKDTAFFDCIYVQDTTGGINAFPVAGDVRAGQTVEIRGTTSSYEGERQIAVNKITIIDKNISALPTPIVLTTAQAAASNSLGSLVKVSGIVTRIVLANNVVESIFVKDASGVECRVFINGYITKTKVIENLAVGAMLTATGLSSIDTQGARIRIRDRADIVCTATGGNTGSIPQTGTTVADTKTGVSATGAIPSNAVLTVSELTLPAKGQNAAADAIRKEMGRGDTVVLVAKDIKLSTSFSGKITVTLPIDAKYNGQTVVILHDNNGKLERYTAIVQNGKVSIEVTSLSPFVVLLYKGGATVPNTGDAPAQMGALLMVLAAAGAVFALRVRRGKKLER